MNDASERRERLENFVGDTEAGGGQVAADHRQLVAKFCKLFRRVKPILEELGKALFRALVVPDVDEGDDGMPPIEEFARQPPADKTRDPGKKDMLLHADPPAEARAEVPVSFRRISK